MEARVVDLAIFMGQSNMAGRGTASEAPVVPKGHGYEFRAISDPSGLYDLVEPFGADENNPSGICEPGRKTGSLVSSFVIEYYSLTKIPVVGVSASKGGSSINAWQPGGSYLKDAIDRLDSASHYLIRHDYQIRKKFMVWCQGETDGDQEMPPDEYQIKLRKMLDAMLTKGPEMCFLIRIGNQRDLPGQYSGIIQAQTDFCKNYKKAVLVSTKFAEMSARNLMKDSFHYRQEAYNLVGSEAGRNTALYILHQFYKAV
ncbi:MAG: sialate O-acetylesterase [Oscillospiraceae bacterium]|jgi:hypothetical protein|nr:sialate O-acetylesterase [Oscillospiraceae bacterium]